MEKELKNENEKKKRNAKTQPTYIKPLSKKFKP